MKLVKFFLVCVLLSFCFHAKADVAIIVNKANAVELSKGKIKRVFLKKIKSFNDGSEIKVANLPDIHPITTQFNGKVLGRTASKLKSYWSKLSFTGSATLPEVVENSAAAIDFVKLNTAAIAYIDASKVTDDVKVLATF